MQNFLQQIALALFSICNSQYFPVFTTVGLFLILLIRYGGAESDTEDRD